MEVVKRVLSLSSAAALAMANFRFIGKAKKCITALVFSFIEGQTGA